MKTQNPINILVTGAQGQLGRDVMAVLQRRGHHAVGTDIADLDITSAQAVRDKLIGLRPDAVIHCAAYTAVDAAEDDESLCRKVNVDGTENIARACGELGCKLIYISTDYVFGGGGTQPWKPEDPAGEPLNVYGRSKLDGELAIQANTDRYCIVRISWAFGEHGRNFVSTMLRLGAQGKPLSVVNDQVGSPTYTADLAELLADMAETDRYGVYHAANEGYCSWYEFAREIFALAGMQVDLRPVTSDAYPVKARRPRNSRLNTDKLVANGFQKLPPWQDAVERYLEAIQ